ncbi:MAG: hypothetical protein ACRC4M_04810 [Mycoplasma sp.]
MPKKDNQLKQDFFKLFFKNDKIICNFKSIKKDFCCYDLLGLEQLNELILSDVFLKENVLTNVSFEMILMNCCEIFNTLEDELRTSNSLIENEDSEKTFLLYDKLIRFKIFFTTFFKTNVFIENSNTMIDNRRYLIKAPILIPEKFENPINYLYKNVNEKNSFSLNIVNFDSFANNFFYYHYSKLILIISKQIKVFEKMILDNLRVFLKLTTDQELDFFKSFETNLLIFKKSFGTSIFEPIKDIKKDKEEIFENIILHYSILAENIFTLFMSGKLKLKIKLPDEEESTPPVLEGPTE